MHTKIMWYSAKAPESFLIWDFSLIFSYVSLVRFGFGSVLYLLDSIATVAAVDGSVLLLVCQCNSHTHSICKKKKKQETQHIDLQDSSK